ncbi:regulator of Vps4 activity in the MVB pathway-domain-containing protein [Irpex rosettiformis]|uniref:Regulator of Vps4 activity in the MVB pathway-domain-containing protein n=1 Tax=Irpex rosettiformis TaxID=378272 RepID=A0ACB8UH87_9APHY|nr:regulator of Vps4 activity in the MVB pathway-domain-containing protein [Irpex rosettiformis]
MTTSWDPARVKSQLRLTAQRLGQLQDKTEAQGQITRRDVAYLLQQRNVAIARAKAQKLIRDDVYGDLLQRLEMLVGVLLEHTAELNRSDSTSPLALEAASSVLYAAPHIESRDLHIVKDLLTQRLGSEFARAAAVNQDNYVSSTVLRDLSARPPTAAQLDHYLYSIAKAHGVHWMPDFQPHEKVDQISAMLDPASIPVVDVSRLRMLCSHGLPEYPPWLRPRVWRLLLGTLPPEKASWKDEARKQRENYYDLVRHLLEPVENLPEPVTPLSKSDSSLVELSKEFTHVPKGLFARLEDEPEPVESCPLDPAALDDIKIPCALALDIRLRLIRAHESQGRSSPVEGVPEIRLETTPEIRLEGPEDGSGTQEQHNEAESSGNPDDANYLDPEVTTEMSLSVPGSPTGSSQSGISTTLLAPRAYSSFGAHPKHASSLLRLLYVHSSLNPANRSPQIASLLIPLYSALIEEVDAEDAAHVEADAFWLFEAMVSEFSELEDAESGNLWMQKFSQRTAWADTELVEDLQAKGLDPALPHYSYRWLTTLLTHTIPLPAVLMVWDAIFSRPARAKGVNPRLDYLLDICSSMLVCARGPLFNLGHPFKQPLNLWGDETTSLISTPLNDHDLEDAFASGMIFLQNYPLAEVGGVDRVLQLAYDFAAKREAERQAASSYSMPTASGISARIRNSVWRTPAQKTIPEVMEDTDEDESEESEEEDDDDKPLALQRPSFSSRLATTVWKGITNQSAIEPPPTPDASPLPSPAPTQEKFPESEIVEAPATRPVSTLWDYAAKMRDSDAAATLAKVSTNWRVKAMDVWTKRNSGGATSAPSTANPDALSPSWVPNATNRASLEASNILDQRRSSLPAGSSSDAYVPPPRPAFFKPVRDSFIAGGDLRPDVISPTGSDYSAFSENDADRYKHQARANTLAALSRTPSPSSAKSMGPRPLLLGSAGSVVHSRSSTMPNNSLDKQFAEAVRAKRPSPTHRGSQSSVSSLSPQDRQDRHTSLSRARTPESTVGSRVVPLNRTVSPMAVARARRQESVSSSASSPVGVQSRLPGESSTEGDTVPAPNTRDSVSTIDSVASPPPQSRTPENSSSGPRVVSSETQRGSVVISEFGEVIDASTSGVASRRKGRNLSLQIDDSSDSSAAVPHRTSRIRSKRFPSRLATLRAKLEAKEGRSSPVDRTPSPNTLQAPDFDEPEATTPKAVSFDQAAPPSRRLRKLSGDNKSRKVSSERVERKHKRESAAAEGDDEGYDELLSAYESEDIQ